MASYREIVTKTVLGKGKKTFSNHYTLTPEHTPTTVLGCWVINHKFDGTKEGNNVKITGACDVNIWYSYNNDTQTEVSKAKITYEELVNVMQKRESNLSDDNEIIVRSLKQPTCTKVDIENGNIEYDIEKELGIEIVGDSKVRIAVDENEDEWDELTDEKVEKTEEDKIMEDIENNVNEDFIKEDKPDSL